MALNPQAEELNTVILENCPAVLEMLSEKGSGIFFPKEGILAQTAEAKGKKFNATIGIATEDDGSPMRLASIAKHFDIPPANAFSYASSYGKPELREKWKQLIVQKNPSLKGKAVSTPVVTNALTHGLTMAAYLFMDPDDAIIQPDLFWGNYKLMFLNGYGTKFDMFPTFTEKGFNVKAFEEKLLTGLGKKIVLLNFPNNPTGYTPTEEEARQIVAAIKKAAEKDSTIVVLIDDAYFGLVYEKGIERQSLFAYLADLHPNVLAVKLDGATKEDYVWGFRVGFITFGIKGGNEAFYKAMEAKTAGAIRGSISNASHLSQSLVLSAYDSSTYASEKKQKYELLKSRYEEVKSVLKAHPEYAECFTALPFNSGYFMCVRVAKGIDAEKVRKKLLDRYDTGVISTGDLLRIAFSSIKKESILPLFKNIFNACKDVRG